MYTLDELIAGEIEELKYQFGFIDEEPDGPSASSDWPMLEDITVEWTVDFLTSHPEGLDVTRLGYSHLLEYLACGKPRRLCCYEGLV